MKRFSEEINLRKDLNKMNAQGFPIYGGREFKEEEIISTDTMNSENERRNIRR